MLRRVIGLARINCMLNAFEILFFAKGAKYNGQSIDMDHFKELDNILYIRLNNNIIMNFIICNFIIVVVAFENNIGL